MYYDLKNLIKDKNSYNYLIAEFFEQNTNKIISAIEINTYWSLIILEKRKHLPGDVQRTLRNFYTKYKIYGIEKINLRNYFYTPQKLNTITYNNLTKRNFKIKDKKDIYNSYNGLCGFCNTKLKFNNSLFDHLIPHSKNGNSDINNCILICENCNLIKKDKDAFKIIYNHAKRIEKIYNNKNIDIKNLEFYQKLKEIFK